MKLLKDESGQAALMMASFLALVALGFMALAIDAGYFFREKRMAQAAADAAAIAAAEESSSGNSVNMQSVANAIAKMNGFDTTLATNPAVVQINNPPKYGIYSGNTGFVEVIVSQPVPTMLLGAFTHTSTKMGIAARAVAGGNGTSPTCICLEEPSGMGLNISNSAGLTATNCGITVDSSSSNAVGMTGAANLSALSLGTVSTNWDNSTNITGSSAISSSTKVVTGVAACSPTLTMPTLPTGDTCYSNPVQGYTAANNYTGDWTLPVAGETAVNGVICYTSLDTSDAAQVTFTPGYTYYVQGNFSSGGGATVNGSGVQFYVGGTVNIGNGATVNLSAPTVSGVSQTLFYVNGSTVTLQGGASSNLSGLLYAPNAAVTLNNGTSTTVSMDIVAQSLTMSGNAQLNSYATSSLGTLNSSVAKVAE